MFKLGVNGLVVIFMFYAIGKLDFSIVNPGTVLINRTDDATFHKFKESQDGFIWTHGMTRRSDVVSISEIGTREKGQVLGCGHYRILATGSSSGFGSGLKQDDIWSAKLNRSESARVNNFVIYNASNPGWGPYHWHAFLESNYDTFNPDLMLVKLSFGDFTLYPKVLSETEKKQWLERDRLKKKILNFDNFGAYAFRKVMYVTENFKNKFREENGESTVKPLGYDRPRYVKHVENHMKSIQLLVDLAERQKTQLLMFLRNADETPAGNYILERIKQLMQESYYAQIIQVDAESFRGDALEEGVSQYYEKYYVLKNDTHPNERYSELMAKKLVEVLPPMLNVDGIRNPCM